MHRFGSLHGLGKDQLVCLDVVGEAVRWRQPLAEGSLILVDGHLVILEQMSGRLRVVAADPEGFRERASLDVLGRSPAFAPPSFAGRTIYVRNHQEMMAVDVVGNDGAR